MTCGERRRRPLEHDRRPQADAEESGFDLGEAPTEISHHLRCPVGGRGGRADGDDRREHLLEGHRVERQHVGGAREVVERVVDLAHVDRADRAQVLGDHEVRIDVGERTTFEPVQVLPGGDALLDDGVDLVGRQPGRERGGRHDPLGARLVGEVAFEGDPGHVVAETELEEDLRRRGQQRDDSHRDDRTVTSPRSRDRRLR